MLNVHECVAKINYTYMSKIYSTAVDSNYRSISTLSSIATFGRIVIASQYLSLFF